MEAHNGRLPEKLLNSNDIAKILGTSKGFAYALMRKGEIRTVRMGKTVRVRPDDLQAFIKNNLDPEHDGETAW